MKYIPLYFLMLAFASGVYAQPNLCVTSANPPVVRAEGLSERIGDILFKCTGAPNTTLTGNFSVTLDANITNRISTGNLLTGTIFTVDSGSGPQPIVVQPLLTSAFSLVYGGVSLTFSPQGTAALVISGIRANANQIPAGNLLIASLAVNGANLSLTASQLTVGTPQPSLYVGFSDKIVCAQSGSPLPDTITFTNLILANTVFASTRVTEGFNDAFGPRSVWTNLNADSGERILVRYSGFPQGARLFVPDVVAGSDAVQPTAGGDFGLPASGGAYAPSNGGSLLLARVAGALPNGAGGAPVYVPGVIGSGTVTFNTVSELSLVNGAAYVVYEVVDANPARQETAQFPTFLGLLPNGSANAVQTNEDVFFAPISTTVTASATEPIPRFNGVVPQPDCSIVGDCATYLPRLVTDNITLQFTAPAGSPATQQGYFSIRNAGGGRMQWSVTVSYTNGSGWLQTDPANGANNTTVRVYAIPGSLAPGAYRATLIINGGPAAGTISIPVTFVITPAPTVGPPVPTITTVVNSASFAEVPVVPGSLTTIMGSAFAGKKISASFDGMPATILYSTGDQINLMVPSELGSKSSAQLVISVDGTNSQPRTVTAAPFAPAIFKGAVLNSDSTVNDVNNGADRGSVMYLYATGLSGAGTITGHIHDRDIPAPYYAGPAPGLLGVQQINLMVPEDLPAMTTEVSVCGTSAATGTKVCSAPAPLTLK